MKRDVLLYSELLSNLLAYIHRDDGHYESEYGTEKAVKDAIEKVCIWIHGE